MRRGTILCQCQLQPRSDRVAYLDHGTGRTAAAALDLDLKARYVMLRLVNVGAVNTNVLKTDEVFAVRSVLRDLSRNVIPVVVAPGSGGEVATVADTLFVDLEPIARAVVGLDASSRSFGHIDKTRAGVLEFSTDSQLGADLVTGVDGQDFGLASGRESTLVTASIRTIDGRAVTEIRRRVRRELDRVVLGRAGRLANVLKGRLGGAADNIGVEEVMSRCHLGNGSESESRELHSDRAVMNGLKKRKER